MSVALATFLVPVCFSVDESLFVIKVEMFYSYNKIVPE